MISGELTFEQAEAVLRGMAGAEFLERPEAFDLVGGSTEEAVSDGICSAAIPGAPAVIPSTPKPRPVGNFANEKNFLRLF